MFNEIYVVALKHSGKVDIVYVKAATQVQAVIDASLEIGVCPDYILEEAGQGFVVGKLGGMVSLINGMDLLIEVPPIRQNAV